MPTDELEWAKVDSWHWIATTRDDGSSEAHCGLDIAADAPRRADFPWNEKTCETDLRLYAHARDMSSVPTEAPTTEA